MRVRAGEREKERERGRELARRPCERKTERLSHRRTLHPHEFFVVGIMNLGRAVLMRYLLQRTGRSCQKTLIMQLSRAVEVRYLLEKTGGGARRFIQ